MSAANCVLARVYVLFEPPKIMILDQVHRLPIQLFDTLPNLSIDRLVIRELEPISPVAKVTRENKQRFRIVKIPRKDLPIMSRPLLVHRPCHYRHQFDILAQALYNVRQVHFEAVLVLFVVHVDHVKAFFLFELVHN
jgi:hypothetical protein